MERRGREGSDESSSCPPPIVDLQQNGMVIFKEAKQSVCPIHRFYLPTGLPFNKIQFR